MRFVEMIYRCRCMDKEAILQMRERGKREDIVDYMRAVQSELAIDHARRSPLCVAPATEYLKLPIEAGAPIGTARGGTA